MGPRCSESAPSCARNRKSSVQKIPTYVDLDRGDRVRRRCQTADTQSLRLRPPIFTSLAWQRLARVDSRVRQAVGEWQVFALRRRSYNAFCITIAALPSLKKSGSLAERFLRSKAVLYKEDTPAALCKNPAYELLTPARGLHRSEGDPSNV